MGWFKVEEKTPQVVLEPGCEPSSVTIKEKRNDRPRFQREYSVSVSLGRRVELSFDSYLSRRASGFLYQANGKWLIFDPDRIADQILDPALVPEVEAAVKSIRAMDKAFIDSKPSSYTDEDGVKWCRC